MQILLALLILVLNRIQLCGLSCVLINWTRSCGVADLSELSMSFCDIIALKIEVV